jgi:branched-chain amino acid transport system substrate-binding protein
MRRFTLSLATLAGLTLATTSANAQITVGFVTSLSGKASSIGLNYEKGINAAYAYQSVVAGQKIKLIKPTCRKRRNWLASSSSRKKSTS